MTAERVEELDIDGIPELMRLVDQVQRTGTARVLTRGGKRVAVLRPVNVRTSEAPHRAARQAATLSAIGGWNGLVDSEKLKTELKESRGQKDRPPLNL